MEEKVDNYNWFVEEGFFSVDVDPSSIAFIHNPDEFFQFLKEKINGAKRRIIFASLYLGNGPKEKELVESFDQVLGKSPKLEVKMLFDYFRGTRKETGKNNTIEMLDPLISRSEVYLYRASHTMKFLPKLLPGRLSEIFGLQHMKFFVFDDSIIISGANLSENYFTNRQDRFLIIEDCPLLANYFSDVFGIISRISVRVNGRFESDFVKGENLDKDDVASALNKLHSEYKNKTRFQNQSQKSSTWLIPFLQMGPFHINQEVDLLNKLMKAKGVSNTLISTGYFNLCDEYADLILKNGSSPITILFASPEANGFYNASGLAGYIPSVYSQNAKNFMEEVSRSKRSDIHLMEWNRPDWSYHAKGVWVEHADKANVATIVGSSNYGFRSTYRDLEAQVLLMTDDEELKRKIIEEKNSLLDHANIVDFSTLLRREYIMPSWIKYLRNFLRSYF